ncbi:TPA: hypothetical protein OUL50_001015 [Clostridioides difficile]|uniref:hypothetical protein n=1 Tax=Clostridioides sp. ES-S-0001-02 TaxID=2770770 RepID=UPI001C13F220|nr:hypothetical protein [Clostridioides sp. ES-S-0001-02]MDI6219300.1 hypothetical protein [Clostridioides difficile]MDN9157809.1 hypothetical protein [Clostridioides difficile]HBG1534367.1 hypothetical protein [Clostridioides difficile]HCU2753334.1 hypothetical protein [Clostridioides difficile]
MKIRFNVAKDLTKLISEKTRLVIDDTLPDANISNVFEKIYNGLSQLEDIGDTETNFNIAKELTILAVNIDPIAYESNTAIDDLINCFKTIYLKITSLENDYHQKETEKMLNFYENL